MKYGKAYLGIVAILTATYDNVEEGETVQIESLSPFVGMFSCKVLSGTRKGETALIHSTRMEQTAAVAQPAPETTTEKTAVPTAEAGDKIAVLKVGELPYATRMAVIERNRKTGLRKENFSAELHAFVNTVNEKTIFNSMPKL